MPSSPASLAASSNRGEASPSPSAALAEATIAAVERQLGTLPRGETAAASWRDFGAVILVDRLEDALPLADRIAPEHLELAVADPEALLGRVRNAGAVFVGLGVKLAAGS